MKDPNTLKRWSVKRFQPTTWCGSVPIAGVIWLLLSLSLPAQSTIQFQTRVFNVAETAGQVTLPVVRMNDLETDVSVEFYSIDGTATAGQDYNAVSGTLSFAAGVTNQTILVPILNDALVESLERFQVVLTNATGGAVLGSMKVASVSIQDNDTGPYFDSATHQVAEDAGTVEIQVNWVIDVDEPQTVDYTAADGTALAGTDYEALNGTLVFERGEQIKQIPVVILNDGVKDLDKSFQVQLSNGSSGGLGNPSLTTVVIQDSTPVIYTQPTPASQSVSLGANVKIQVSAKGARMQWQKRVGEGEFTDIPGATSQVLEWSSATVDMSGDYKFVVSSSTGESVTSQIAAVSVDPTFIKITGQPIVEDVEPSGTYAWLDYDGDGLADFFVCNWMATGAQVSNSLYRNQGDGTFTKVSNALTTAFLGGFAVYLGDYDNDGRPDILMGKPSGSSRILRNQGAGEFTLLQDSFPALYDGAWHDLDEDGWLDLLIFGPSGARAFRNSGTGGFEPFTTGEVGDLGTINHGVVGVSFADFDNDGNPDLYVGADNGNARLLRNLGGGRFEQVRLGSLPATMGDSAIWADYDNDGFIDAVTCGWAGVLKLHRNVASMQDPALRQFQEVTAQAGLSLPPSGLFPSPNWGDFDNDGDLDVFFANYQGINSLFVNQGDGTFVPVEIGCPLRDGEREFGNWVDYDNDGFLDLFFVAGDGQPMPNFLYRNNLKNAGNENHWLRVRLEGRASNRSGIGSVLRLRATIDGREVMQLRQTAKAGWDTVPQSVAHFGLGDAATVDTLLIEWPSGIVQELKDVAVNQHLEVVETQGVILPEPMTFEAFGRDAQGVFQATVNCPVEGVLCVMQASSDFERWSKVQVRTNVTGTVEFTDAHAVDSPTRFYRVLVP